MFDRIYERPYTLARYRTGPLVDERIAFLMYLVNQGYSRLALRQNARDLLVIAQMIVLPSRPRNTVTLASVRRKMASRSHLYPLAVRWLRFLGRLQEQSVHHTPYAKEIKAFTKYMEHEEGLSPVTISGRCCWVRRFFDRLPNKGRSLHDITPRQIDTAIQKMLKQGSYSRRSIQGCASALRTFCRFAEMRGLCRKGLAASIQSPRVFSQASLPLGPSWDDVRRLLALAEGNQPHNIRVRPMLMLFAIYGLRRGEVSRLRIKDFDWEHETFRVVSSKTGRIRIYPLMRSVGDAILRYLQEVRPRSLHPELFLSLRPPFRPLCTSLSKMVGNRLRFLGVSLPHYGSHSLRHACAARLLAAGLSLKEIGDQLGHVDPDSTRVYAKVDLAGLREVADFEIGGVL